MTVTTPGLIPLVLHLTVAGAPPERAISTAILFNLAVAGGPAAADALLAANSITALRPLLLEPGLTCLAATLVAGHLVWHIERGRGDGRRRPSRAEAEVLAEAEPSILAFSDRLPVARNGQAAYVAAQAAAASFVSAFSRRFNCSLLHFTLTQLSLLPGSSASRSS